MDRSSVPALLNAGPLKPLTLSMAPDWKSKVAPDWLSIVVLMALAKMLFVPVTAMEPVLVRVPVRYRLPPLVAIKSAPLLVTVPARPGPFCTGAHCKTVPVKLRVAPAPVKSDSWTAPAPEPVSVPEKLPPRMTVAPVPALTIPGPPLPPPVKSRVPELPAMVPESFTGI